MKDLYQYIGECIAPQDEVLLELTRQTNLRVLQPRMLSGHLQGEFLEMTTAMIAPKRVLELGTFTGYSAICIARALGDDAVLHTIERHDELEAIASEFFAKAGVQHKIAQHFGKALEVMESFNEPFDMVFMDADKREYDLYYNMLFERGLLKVGSVIIADNTLWDGHVLKEPLPSDAQTQGIDRFNRMVGADSRVQKVILPLRDGISIIRVIKLD